MSVVYGKFEMPKKIKADTASATPTFVTFIAEPLERGFGHTLGNTLRRTILSCLEAPAVVAVAIEGVSHEYMAVEGIIEDVTNILLNFKGALLRKLPMDDEVGARAMRHISTEVEVTSDEIKKEGQRVVTLGDVFNSSEFEVINPELPLFTATQPMKRRIDLRVAMGRGYEPSERIEIENRVAGEMVIDGLFSPVRSVNYRVENTRVGQATDFDRLVLEVKTDGRITPQEALSFASQITSKHLDVFHDADQMDLVFQRDQVVVSSKREEVLSKISLRVSDIELSVRSTNCLNEEGIRYIGQLAVMSESEMLRFRNFGKKSLTEIRDKLEEFGLGFNVNLSGYGIDANNVIDVIEEYLAERQLEEQALVEESPDEA